MKKKISAWVLICTLSFTLTGCSSPFSCVTKCGMVILIPIALVILIPIIAKTIKTFSGIKHESKMNKIQEKAMEAAVTNASKSQPESESKDKDDMQIF